MADNPNPREQPAAPHQGVPAQPPALRQPTEVTPEQVREFQEFQRFQELMRQQAEQGLPPGTPPPPGTLVPWGQPQPEPSLAKRLLKSAVSKIITGLVVLAILVFGAWFAIDYFLSPDLDKPPASKTGGGRATTNLIFETSPRGAVLKVYDDIAQGDAKSACGRFTDDARAQFEKNMSEYGDTCGDIVRTIHATVANNGMKSEYAKPLIPGSAVPTAGTTVSVSSCALEVTGGPRLGLLTLSEIPRSEGQGTGGAQWIVSGHETEPADCVGMSSTPPTS